MANSSAAPPPEPGAPAARPTPVRRATPTSPELIETSGMSESAEVIESREVFLGAISHELRTPMATLKAAAQLLVRRLDAPDDRNIKSARKLAKAVDRQADKL